MGNGASSSQGSLPSHDKRDVGTSVDSRKQHDWQPEQAVAPKQETHSLQVETRKPYVIIMKIVQKVRNKNTQNTKYKHSVAEYLHL